MNSTKQRLLRIVISLGISVVSFGECALVAALSSTEDQIVTTRHRVKIAGRILNYTARAGRLPILNNETGEVYGNIFFTSYTLDSSQTAKTRPLTFLWNGGPGSSSSLVHLLGFGPRKLQPDGTPIDNQGTWLEHTDLVFVDPVGTGYSRPTKAEYGPEFYQTWGDAESVAEFIRVYRNRFETWEAPIFLAGESFGVIRVAGVADVLQRRGIIVNGVVLIGLTLPLGQLSTELRTALAVPTYTSAAYANKKLEPALQADLPSALRQAEEWARTVYAPALVRRGSLDDQERKTVAAQLARFSGLDSIKIDQKTLTIGMELFTTLLLADSKEVVGRYDSRLIGPLDPDQKIYDPTKDPSLKDIINDVGIVRYFRNELQYKSDLKYQGPFGGGYPPATAFRGDWMSVRWNRPSGEGTSGSTERQREGGATAPDQPLRRALIADPKLQVFIACGYYDLVCSYAANAYLASHLDPEVPRNVISRGYGGGHALYTDPAAQLDMKRDVIRFMQDAVRSRATNRSARITQINTKPNQHEIRFVTFCVTNVQICVFLRNFWEKEQKRTPLSSYFFYDFSCYGFAAGCEAMAPPRRTLA